MNEEVKKQCSTCGKPSLQRLVSKSAGVIFKGSGFYVNDSKAKPSASVQGSSKDTASSKEQDSKAKEANFHTENGEVIENFHLFYTSYGYLNKKRDNVVWFIHPLTSTSDPMQWWGGVVGLGHIFDPQRYFIICVNNPGSPYGSTSPLDINPRSAKPYYHDFPTLTIRDVVQSFEVLREALHIDVVRIACGASMGGQILYQWLCSYPSAISSAIIIAASPVISTWMLASHHIQLQSIYADPTWKERHPDA
ncbi:homoserine O-acetyltransferase-like, partial [Ylistrum balloti]|uniref:homoserine O-acetyltransferase-like n=1 Tax=Ylistrum balloti TaxID=509963 RepID=UPI002905F472